MNGHTAYSTRRGSIIDVARPIGDRLLRLSEVRQLTGQSYLNAELVVEVSPVFTMPAPR